MARRKINLPPLAAEALKDMKTAIKDFGEYQYGDKGPWEVMDVEKLVNKFRALTPDAAAAQLVALSKVDYNAETLAQSIVGSLQEWNELFDHLPEDFDW